MKSTQSTEYWFLLFIIQAGADRLPEREKHLLLNPMPGDQIYKMMTYSKSALQPQVKIYSTAVYSKYRLYCFLWFFLILLFFLVCRSTEI